MISMNFRCLNILSSKGNKCPILGGDALSGDLGVRMRWIQTAFSQTESPRGEASRRTPYGGASARRKEQRSAAG